MRTERVMELADLLRGRDAMTVAEIAAELGVTERTVYRDLALLRDRGMPITGEAGPGGGVRLERDRGVAAVHLGLDEAVALWLAASLGRRGTVLPWGDAARSALDKLLGSLPRERAHELRRLLRRVVVGPPATEAMRASAGTTPRELLAVFELAFRRRVGMRFHYEDRNGARTTRTVEPHGLLVQPPVWYILARDVEKEASRMFRMDRIARPELVPTVTFEPSMAIVEELSTPPEDSGARARDEDRVTKFVR